MAAVVVDLCEWQPSVLHRSMVTDSLLGNTCYLTPAVPDQRSVSQSASQNLLLIGSYVALLNDFMVFFISLALMLASGNLLVVCLSDDTH